MAPLDDEVGPADSGLESATVALAAAADVGELSDVIIREVQRRVACDGVMLYVWADNDPTTVHDDHLDLRAVHITSLGLALGGKSGQSVNVAPVPIYDRDTGAPRVDSLPVHAADAGVIIGIDDVYSDTDHDLSDLKAFDAKAGYKSQNLLAVPLMDQRDFARGVMILVNARDENGAVTAFTDDDRKVCALLSSHAAITLGTIMLREQLIETGIALSAERNSAKLLERILLEAKNLANADGGTLYLRTEKDTLKFAILRNDSMKTALGGTSGNPITFPDLQMYDPDTGEANHNAVATHVALSGETINVEDAYNVTGFDFSGAKRFDESTGYRSKSFLTVPLKNYEGEVIGVLQLINAQDSHGATIVFDNYIVPLVEALTSQAAVALDNQKLIEAQRNLFTSFINLTAQAIDAKSPYTGGHCNRVPVITKMLAQAAVDNQDKYQDFALTEDEWYELDVAAGLHDCGKVTTPEYVVDKATKLETIYNRIHEVRMRFEVVKRDAEIEYLNNLIEGKGDPEQLKTDFEARIAQLDDDFAFVAECNVGGEFMADEKLERLAKIGEETWVRTLDDTLGLGHEELKLYPNEGADRATPETEKLLDDKPEHLVPHIEGFRFDDKGEGFVIKPPEYKFNRGELYNLGIKRGTLSDEDRFHIQDHIIQTILMLKKLPFPKNLARVPEYAGGHHETMIGTGYPKGLTKDQMSVPARIMAIADIFEALTAADRPYKKAKKLSEAIKIMSFMKKDEHIDPDLFELFLTSGAYKDYAEKYLKPEQIDEVDISQYITTSEAAE